jgi:mRNA interferase MazF
MTPQRWHLWIVNLEPWVGSKPGQQRPCLVVQPTAFGDAGLTSTVVLPLTSQILKADAFPLRVRVPKGTCGLTSESEIMIDQILAWDNRYFSKDLGPLPEAIVDHTKHALREFLDLDP